MSEYTLHGRSLKVGDKVWIVRHGVWTTIVDECSDKRDERHSGSWTIASFAALNHQNYAWDQPPAVDLSQIPPPLCWIEGHPVRKGAAMLAHGCAFTVIDTSAPGTLSATNIRGVRYVYDRGDFTFALPPSTRPMKTVTVRRWINKYPDIGYESEEEAKKEARKHSQGQMPITYTIEVPA